MHPRFRRDRPAAAPSDPPLDGALTRRGVLAGTGALGLAGVLAACGVDQKSAPAASSATGVSGADSATTSAAGGSGDLLNELLAQAPQCPTTAEATEGPYWFDVDRIRADIREDREGVPLELALRVVDLENCRVDGDPAPVRDAVVEIWHCDAEGNYSGFESGTAGGPPVAAAGWRGPAGPAEQTGTERSRTAPTVPEIASPRRRMPRPICAARSPPMQTASCGSPASIRAGTGGGRCTSTCGSI
ncbi:hypothetical protein [Gordonia alkaliphila]|uniref:hypothetical protein n=1 Tax=Gordonia alkaliphila TaxID=1053547 RepID=UPI0027E285B0|nr:hypothetical protein [Gordonia alkaliphila]